MKRYKKQSEFAYTLGMAVTYELLLHKPNLVNQVFVHSKIEKNDTYDALTKICRHHHIAVVESDKAFNILSPKENCFMMGEFKKFTNPIQQNESHIVLVNPSNAGNLGTILRSTVGLGINNIVLITPCVDLFDSKVIRASMGAFFQANVLLCDDFYHYAKTYPAHNLYCFRLQSSQMLKDTQFLTPFSLVFGNEATGLPDTFASIGQGVRIPHNTSIDSLNLPIAASIALYEVTKQNF